MLLTLQSPESIAVRAQVANVIQDANHHEEVAQRRQEDAFRISLVDSLEGNSG